MIEIFIVGMLTMIGTIFSGMLCIPLLRRLNFGQNIRVEGPKSHQIKNGTPTVGGFFLIICIIVITFLRIDFSSEILLAIFVTLGHFVLGFVDDLKKIINKSNQGLRARQKFLGQILIAIILILSLHQLNFSQIIWLPIINQEIHLGFVYDLFVLFVIIGASNAVNLTDGLDGLASGCMAIASGFYSVICLIIGQSELAIFCAAITGACVGFLKFNFHPAKVFMGDTGSLALGGALAVVGILTHTELLLMSIGFIFFCETLSVILQVISFKMTGKRIFRMSPLHHHFELIGWSETKIVFTFWIVEFLFGTVSLLIILGAY